MPDAPEQPEVPRRSFIEPAPPKPFLKTREGRRIALLGLLFVLAGAVMYRQYRKTMAVVERAAAERALAEAAPAVPIDERLAQKRAELPTAFEGALADSDNGDGFVETAGYRKLIELLSTATPEDITAKSSTYLDHAGAMEEPDLFRGEYAHVRGLVGGLWAVKLERSVSDITDVWRGTVAQPDAESETVVFDLIGPRPDIELQRTVVEVDGLFYRTVAYESRTGQHREVPYLLARNLRVIEDAAPTGAGGKTLAIALGLVAILAYLILRSSLRSTKRQAARTVRFKAPRELRRHSDGDPSRP